MYSSHLSAWAPKGGSTGILSTILAEMRVAGNSNVTKSSANSSRRSQRGDLGGGGGVLRLRGVPVGMGASGPPGSKFGRHRPFPSIGTRNGCTSGERTSGTATGPLGERTSGTETGPLGAGFHQGRLRGGLGRGGDCSGGLSSSERSCPQVHFVPSASLPMHALRARIGVSQIRQRQLQWAASLPH